MDRKNAFGLRRMATTRTLAAVISAEPHEAEAELVEKYQPGLSRRLRRQTDVTTAEDLCQDCFVVAVTALRRGSIREPLEIKAFLSGTARTLMQAHIRRKAYAIAKDNMDGYPSHLATPVEIAERTETANLVGQLLLGLASARDRELLTRRYLLDQDTEAICRDMDLTESAFRLALHRARARAKRQAKKLIRPESG